MRYRSTGPRFYDFRPMTARFDSKGECGHEIHEGDRIGYSRRHRQAYCPACWERWESENAEAEYLERNPSACPW